MNYRLFDPTVVPRVDDYRSKYPELDKIPEFKSLKTRALIFIWWLANPTSDVVLNISDPSERVKEALKRSGYKPGNAETERLLRLQFDDDLALAKAKMEGLDPGSRFKGYQILNNILSEYSDIVKGGIDNFATKSVDKEGGAITETVDYQKYVNTTSKIVETLPTLIAKMEEGFGITVMKGAGGDDEEYTGNFMRDYHRSRDGGSDGPVTDDET